MSSHFVIDKKHRTSIALIGALTALAVGAFAWLIRNDLPTDNPEQLVNTFVDVVSEGALKSDGVDWQAARRAALAELPKKAREQDVYRAYRTVLYALGDNHTVHIQRAHFAQLSAAKPDNSASTEFVKTSVEPGGITRIDVREYTSVNPKRFVADGLNALAMVEAALPPSTCGIIVDLSANTGGNMYPMFVALMPLLGIGTLMQHVDRHGKAFKFSWALDDEPSKTWLGDGATLLKERAEKASAWNEAAKRPIAVIQSRLTGSSGEATLIAMRGRSHVKTFGSPSAGYATSNKVIPLADGSALALTVARMADRNGRVYDAQVSPDVDLSASNVSANQAAMQYLRETCPENGLRR
jgi:carboxyl-terminal processing protease